MSTSTEIYISNRDLAPNAFFRQAMEGARVQFQAADDTYTEGPHWVRCKARFGQGNIILQKLDIRSEEIGGHLEARCSAIEQQRNEENTEYLTGLLRRIRSTRTLFVIEAPEQLEHHIAPLARGLASEMDGLLYHDGSLTDAEGRVCLDAEGSYAAGLCWPTPASALARKERSEARMRQNGMPVDEDLPAIEGDEEAQLRPASEVARRASVIVAASARAEGMEQQRAVQFLEAWGIWEAASPKEQAYLTNPAPAESDRIANLWKYECLWVMLWALGQVEALGAPAGFCDVRRAVKIVTGVPTDQFIANATLRPVAEILDECDFTLRCHAVLEAARNSEEPAAANIDPGVAMERLIAFNWLRCHRYEAWDDVTPGF